MKVETGVMIVKDGKGWSGDKHYLENKGWVSLEDAKIYNTERLTKPEDATYPSDYFSLKELRKGHFVNVTRTTTVEVSPYTPKRELMEMYEDEVYGIVTVPKEVYDKVDIYQYIYDDSSKFLLANSEEEALLLSLGVDMTDIYCDYFIVKLEDTDDR